MFYVLRPLDQPNHMLCKCTIVSGGHREGRVSPPVDPWGGPRQSDAPHPLLFLGMEMCTVFPQPGLFQGQQPWESKVLWGLNPVKGSIWASKTLRGRCRKLLILRHSRQAWYASSLASYTCHLPIWRDLPLSSTSPCPTMFGDQSSNQQIPA